jgi:hypothetical protein
VHFPLNPLALAHEVASERRKKVREISAQKDMRESQKALVGLWVLMHKKDVKSANMIASFRVHKKDYIVYYT